MYFSKASIVSFGLLATSELVAGHSAVVAAVGDAGGQGSAIGVDPATPRDGTRRNPFQQDATRFKGAAADACGETLGGGDNDIEAGTAQVMQQNGGTLPQVSQGGEIMMTLHQVNGDGAGPYTCMIDSTGTGTNWTEIQVTTNVDGNERGRNNDQQMQDLPLAAAIPADQTCDGTVAGQSNVCMVRCQNPARAGPFGGCVPVQMKAAVAAAAPAAAAPAAAAPAAAAPAAAAPAAGAAAPAAAAPAAAPAAPAAAGAGAAAPVPAAGAADVAGAADAQTAGAQTPATGATAQAPGAAAVPAANAQAPGAAGAVSPAAGAAPAAAPAAGAAGAANPATGATAGALPATGATAKREAKQLDSNGPVLTDDDQEEEVELLGDDMVVSGDQLLAAPARYVANDN